LEENMLFRTSTLRSRLTLCAASVALAFGLAAGPAEAGSNKTQWFRQDGSSVLPGSAARQDGTAWRRRQPAQTRTAVTPMPAPPATAAQPRLGNRPGKHTRYIAPVPKPPQSSAPGHRRSHDRRSVAPAPQPPSYASPDRRRSHDRRFGPSVPPPVYADRGRHHRGDHKHYKDKRRRHETHVTPHHVQRYYYYRTSSRHYYYYYDLPRSYSYPVYYLVPYHVHTSPGYHYHGEEAAYCSDGYRQGGVYSGGAYTRGPSHQPGATLLGGIIGAVAGAQVGNGKGQLVAIGVGTALGALIGSDLGRAMDARDHAYATGSFGHALETVPSCTTITWNNAQTGNYGSITPVQTYEPEPGRYCREFQQQVVIGGQVQDAYGTACRQPDGSWEIVAEQP
jgi:surface antigen